MAEFVFKDMVKKQGLENEFYIESAATSSEEIGNGMHYGTIAKLKEQNISFGNKTARKLTQKDYDKFDYILGMEKSNIYNINRIIGEDSKNKVHRLLDFSQNPRDIADPWYTGNFDITYDDILEGCKAFLKYIEGE
jgi:protein-tyrosine phosphatase